MYDENHWVTQGTMHNHRPLPWDDNPYQDLPMLLAPLYRGFWLGFMRRYLGSSGARNALVCMLTTKAA